MIPNCSVGNQTDAPSTEEAMVCEPVSEALQRSLAGHFAFTMMHAGNETEAISGITRQVEMQRRGVRFCLPK